MKDESRIYVIAGSILVLTGAHYFTAMANVQVHDLFRRLYFVPIIYAAYSFGLRGGLATAAIVSVLYLPFIFLRIHGAAQRFDQYLEIAVFYGIGLITGMLSQKEKEAFKRLENLTLGVIRSLVTAIEAKDPYTKGHSVRVMQVAMILGRTMNFSPSELRRLKIGALLHDIGKIAIDLSILHKHSKLQDSEFQIVKKHPEWGVRILGEIEELKDVLPVVLHHHEKYDGTGYPSSLSKTEIPLYARIISVADTFDALTSNRPYRKALSIPDALKEIKSASGNSLDPEIVDLFISHKIQEEVLAMRNIWEHDLREEL
ncbi:HD-GYP domain-containing protein [bacterium]|nr:HD-GYP domain-containing protein [bacterium]